MLYHLHEYADLFGGFNLFRYISFRAGGAVVTSLLLSLLLGPALIRWLREKKIGQSQREDGPKSHLSKSGTPTMGGLLIVATVTTSTLLWMRWDERFTWVLLFVTLSLTAVGFWDDYLKLIRKDPKGAPSRVKFAIQTLTALVVVGYLAGYAPNAEYSTSLLIPFIK